MHQVTWKRSLESSITTFACALFARDHIVHAAACPQAHRFGPAPLQCRSFVVARSKYSLRSTARKDSREHKASIRQCVRVGHELGLASPPVSAAVRMRLQAYCSDGTRTGSCAFTDGNRHGQGNKHAGLADDSEAILIALRSGGGLRLTQVDQAAP